MSAPETAPAERHMGEGREAVTRAQFEDTAIGKALSARRSMAAGDFKDPQHQGQRGCDWDAGFIAACRIVEANTFASAATPTALPSALLEALADFAVEAIEAWKLNDADQMNAAIERAAERISVKVTK